MRNREREQQKKKNGYEEEKNCNPHTNRVFLLGDPVFEHKLFPENAK